MKTSITNIYGKKVFVVDTEIAKAAYREGITSPVVKDDKGNQVFRLCVNLDADEGTIYDSAMMVNGVSDAGTFVAIFKMDADETIEDVKKLYGSKLVAAQKYLETLKTQMINEAAAVDGIFAGVANAETVAE